MNQTQERKSQLVEELAAALEQLRHTRPLVHNITNMVVMNDTANILLHIGASPVMAHAREEVEEMVSLAGALVLNIGTLTPDLVESMLVAGKKANQLGVPVILDPVGAGATRLRTESSLKVLEAVRVAILRGNSAEIGVLAGYNAKVRGVDAVESGGEPVSIARRAARKFGLTVAITGKQDVISDGERVVLVDNGHEMMGCLTGTGCMSTALIGAFMAVATDPVMAAAAALVAFGVAGEAAAKRSLLPGSFKAALFDEIYGMTPDRIREEAKVSII
ncbi:MAG: hydroxyethylthiazole kinase [Bacillota bacterium]